MKMAGGLRLTKAIKKMRYFITFSYDGSNYHGWQIQPNGNSVQAELQRALTILLRRETTVVGAGRTDAGVHARMMVAHFDTETALEDCRQAVYRLNRILPRDISVSRVEQVAEDMHARFSATSRTYRYYIHTRKDPFCRAYSCELHYELDFVAMNEAAAVLGAVSGLYDKYLMAPVEHGGVGLDKMMVQSWYNIYQCFMMGAMMMIIWWPKHNTTTPFHWDWSIICVSIFLSAADFVYFYSLSHPGAMISVVSMIRRGSVLVSFLFGAVIFHEKNLRSKAVDLALVLLGMVFLYIGSK